VLIEQQSHLVNPSGMVRVLAQEGLAEGLQRGKVAVKAPQVVESEGIELAGEVVQRGPAAGRLAPELAGGEKVETSAESEFPNHEEARGKGGEARRQVIAMQENILAFTQRVGL